MEPKPPQTPKIKTELVPEEKKSAHFFESLTILDRAGKMDLILVWRGLKTVSQLSIFENATPSQISDLKNKIHQANLLFKEEVNLTKPKKYPIPISGLKKVYFVAKNQDDLNLFSSLWFGDHLNDPKVYKEIGRMSGFPQTAINTFHEFSGLSGEERNTKKKSLTLSPEEKKDLFPPELFPFSLRFYVSREHWQSELETIQKWAEEIKLVAPALYQSFVDQFKDKKK